MITRKIILEMFKRKKICSLQLKKSCARQTTLPYWFKQIATFQIIIVIVAVVIIINTTATIKFQCWNGVGWYLFVIAGSIAVVLGLVVYLQVKGHPSASKPEAPQASRQYGQALSVLALESLGELLI